MSMNGAQASAFQAASGFPASSSYLFFVGVAVAITFVWGPGPSGAATEDGPPATLTGRLLRPLWFASCCFA